MSHNTVIISLLRTPDATIVCIRSTTQARKNVASFSPLHFYPFRRGKASTVLILNVSQKSPNPKARYGGLVRWRSVELGLATVLNGILVKGGREHFIW
ncbi:hypothetical protein V6N11_008393 [Hibiscus sabdariffa]